MQKCVTAEKAVTLMCIMLMTNDHEVNFLLNIFPLKLKLSWPWFNGEACIITCSLRTNNQCVKITHIFKLDLLYVTIIIR